MPQVQYGDLGVLEFPDSMDMAQIKSRLIADKEKIEFRLSQKAGIEAPLSDEEQASAERLSDFAANARLTPTERMSGNVAKFLGSAEEYVVKPSSKPFATMRKGAQGILANAGITSPETFQEEVAIIDNPVYKLPYGGGPEQPKSTQGKVFRGVADAIIDFVNVFGDPDAALQMGLAGVPSAGQKALITAFAVSMGKEAPGQLVDAASAAERGDTREAARLATGGVGAAILSTLMARHANAPVKEAGPLRPGDEFKSELPPVTPDLQTLAPRTAEAVEGKAKVTEVPKVEPKIEEPKPEIKGETDAIQVQSPNEKVLRQPQPEVGLPQVGEGNAKPQEPSTTQQEAPGGGETGEITGSQGAISTPGPATPEPPKSKWTSATEDSPGETLGGQLYAGIPNPVAVYHGIRKAISDYGPDVKRAAEAIIEFGNQAKGNLAIQHLNDRRRAVLNWSAKLQRSFGEADAAQREIRAKVPDKVRREGITNWIQANGDAAELANRASQTQDPKLRAGYEAAMNLSPEEFAVANDVRAAYDSLGARGQQYDVLKSFVENYVTQIWDLGKGPAVGSSRTLKDQFRFAKARTFNTFFDGEQAGYTPKTKDISELLPVYLHEMNSVIAARQMVAEMGKGVASDGRPLLAPSGSATVVEGDGGKAVLVKPKAVKGDTSDYRRLENQPALNGWTWIGKDTDGAPIFEKSDLALHPEAYAHLKNILGRSAIKEWYDSKTTLTAAIPKAIVKGLDRFQSETKRTMLGFFAPFHQVQEGTHAVGHRVNPFFNNPKIDLVNNAGQMDAARHGLMLLPDRASADNFMEGFRTSGLVSKIPGIGRAADWYSHYLFHQYIPGLKFKTYEHILKRNMERYAGDIASGEVKPSDVKALSASQANAAYGHLNYADLARNPTIQHMMQMGLLAPDFLEARARFEGQAIKGIAGAKVGREQLLAVATLALAQAALAYTAAKVTGGEWEASHPFEFRKGNRRYTMRSVPEDNASFMTDTRRFIYSRLSPTIGRGAVQLLSGVDWRGQPTTAAETVGELAKAPIPLTLRGAAGNLPWVGDMLKPNTSLSIPEQLWGAAGIRISRYSPQAEVYQMADEFKKKSGVPKLVTQAQQREREVNPPSTYKGLRDALGKNDLDAALVEYKKLIPTKGNAHESAYKLIEEAMNPRTSKGEKPFTGSRETEMLFVQSLTPSQKKIYEQAKEERREMYRRFRTMLSKYK